MEQFDFTFNSIDNFNLEFDGLSSVDIEANDSEQMCDITFEGEDNHFDVEFENAAVFQMTYDKVIEIMPNPYQGEYRFTPTREKQTVLTGGKSLSSNIIIDPIPSNYGLVTWTGSVLTIT